MIAIYVLLAVNTFLILGLTFLFYRKIKSMDEQFLAKVSDKELKAFRDEFERFRDAATNDVKKIYVKKGQIEEVKNALKKAEENFAQFGGFISKVVNQLFEERSGKNDEYRPLIKLADEIRKVEEKRHSKGGQIEDMVRQFSSGKK